MSLQENRRRQNLRETGPFRDWDDFLASKGDDLERALGVRLGRILGCGAMGCVVQSDPGKVVKLAGQSAHRSLGDGSSFAQELAFWTRMKAEQDDPDSPASKGVVRVHAVSLIEDRETGNRYIAVVREAVTPALVHKHGDPAWSEDTIRRVCPENAADECSGSFFWKRWPKAENAVRAVVEYQLEDVHPGNIGWRGDELVVFDAHTAIKYLERDEMKQMRVNREREVQKRRGEYDATFTEWSRLVAFKGDDLQEALGAKVGDIIGCGAFGCVVSSDPGKVIKLSSFQAHGGGDEELSFWTHMKREQERPNSPASKGVVKIDKVAIVEDSDTGEEYVAVLREDVEPFYDNKNGGLSPETKRRMATLELPASLRASGALDLSAAAGAQEAIDEYGLTDVHAGNLGWSGGKLVIYDAHMRDEPEDEGIDLRLRVNDGYSPFHEHLPGGLASGMSPGDFDPEQLARGVEVELEHIGSGDRESDREIATEVAMDHLVEDPLYYQKLARMESNMSSPRAEVGLNPAMLSEGDQLIAPWGETVTVANVLHKYGSVVVYFLPESHANAHEFKLGRGADGWRRAPDPEDAGLAPNASEELSENPGGIHAGMTAQEAVLRAFRSMNQPFTMSEVERVAEKISRRGDIQNLPGFAYVAVRNYVISRARSQAAAARHAEHAWERSKAEREQERFETAAREELEGIADAILLAGPGPKQTREGLENQINMVLAVYAMGYSPAQTAQLFPGTSKEARYQWKNRGLKLIWPHASADLRRFLHEGGSGRWPTRGEGLTENARAFYVFEMSGQKPLRQVNVKPLTLAKAKQLARIGAQNGKHDRAVTTDPRKEDFRVVGGYEAGYARNEKEFAVGDWVKVRGRPEGLTWQVKAVLDRRGVRLYRVAPYDPVREDASTEIVLTLDGVPVNYAAWFRARAGRKVDFNDYTAAHGGHERFEWNRAFSVSANGLTPAPAPKMTGVAFRRNA